MIFDAITFVVAFIIALILYPIVIRTLRFKEIRPAKIGQCRHLRSPSCGGHEVTAAYRHNVEAGPRGLRQQERRKADPSCERPNARTGNPPSCVEDAGDVRLSRTLIRFRQ